MQRRSPKQHPAGRIAALLTGTALGAVALASPVLAQDATWVGNGTATGNWNTGTNWTCHQRPDGYRDLRGFADDDRYDQRVHDIDTIQFNASASAYTFNKTGGGFWAIAGSNGGILNNSGVTQTINVSGGLLEFDGGSAGSNVTINNSASTTFTADSSAGSATINVTAGGFLLSFTDQSTAGSAIITTNAGSKTQFSTNATGGAARLITSGATAVVDFSNTTGPNSDNKITAGTIEGDGLFYLGPNSAHRWWHQPVDVREWRNQRLRHRRRLQQRWLDRRLVDKSRYRHHDAGGCQHLHRGHRNQCRHSQCLG